MSFQAVEMSGALDVARTNAHRVKVATHYDKVWKDECMLCYCTPRSPGGLYINLGTFQAFCPDHVQMDQERTGQVLYLHAKSNKVRTEWNGNPR